LRITFPRLFGAALKHLTRNEERDIFFRQLKESIDYTTVYIVDYLNPLLEQKRRHGKLRQGQASVTIGGTRCKYSGEINEIGLAEGNGEAKRLGVSYKGTFHENRLEGVCTVTYPWGTREECEMKASKQHGKLTVYYANGHIFNCVFKNGERR